MKISYALAACLCAGMAAHAQESPLWNEFVASRASGRTATLPDFSWAGYHFSEKELPNGASKKVFNVKDYGALPNDDRYDDDAIQLAVRAAEAHPGGGIVFFPAGKFLICPDEDQSRRITIRQSGIVLRGSGTGANGTEIFANKMRIGTRQFRFEPEKRNVRKLAVIHGSANLGSHWVSVEDASELKAGQDVTLRHKSEAFTRRYFAPQELHKDWTRLFGANGGMNIQEIHTIAEVKGNRVRFANPLHIAIEPVDGHDFILESFDALEECGIEGIRFTGNWNSYPEEFVHHKDSIHDAGWCAVAMEFVKDSWVRDCVFDHWNEGVFIRAGYRITLTGVQFGGKGGHSTIHARSGYGVLIKNCDFLSGHHGPGTGYTGVNTVVTSCRMAVDQNIDSHSGQPYATLFDNVRGGVFRNIGGPQPGFPHHGRDLVFWNFEHRSTWDFTYDFWDLQKRKNHTFAQPVFVGFQSDRKIAFKNEGTNESTGRPVEPRSLFDAQLALRLKAGDAASK
ncbi:DUF4955 domain-containing protein [Chitinophaga pollutisoli]|uniref:DUF4955 domain-containing protein n=1 Tax=Chitinophaga pollutisoli TaxID=3133966 RepID=A0ABZ2YKN4_9BACT